VFSSYWGCLGKRLTEALFQFKSASFNWRFFFGLKVFIEDKYVLLDVCSTDMELQTMSGLGLVPNEVVGYRIKPDWYNFTVCVVKRFGKTSKKVGQEYEEPLAYCRSLESSAAWLLQHVVRIEGEALQDQIQATKGSVASVDGLLAAMQTAQVAVLRAVAELETRLEAAGLDSPKKVHLLLNGSAPETDKQID
jgi:hypothetical protein